MKKISVASLPLAPVLVMLCEGVEGLPADTLHMPVGVDKIHPFLAAVAAGWAVKEAVGSSESHEATGS